MFTIKRQSEEEIGLFFQNLKIKSFEMYMPVLSKLTHKTDRRQFEQLLNMLTARSATMEMVRHSKMTDSDFNPGTSLRYIVQDVLS
jgi:hypothetical protein